LTVANWKGHGMQFRMIGVIQNKKCYHVFIEHQ